MTTLYCAILVAGFTATASLAAVNPQRMQRDIHIMEGVLGNLYHAAPDPTHFSPRGLYLDGYGVLFFTEVSWHPSISVAFGEKGVKHLEVESGTSSSYEKSLAESHDLLAEFLGNYAGIIGQLDPDDRITVCYQRHPSGLGGLEHISHSFTVGTGTDSTSFDLTKQIEAMVRMRKRLEEAASEVEIKGAVAKAHGLTPRHHRTTAAASLITATAKKSAIDAFREGRIDSATFRQRIAFSEHTDSKKIDIMAGILDQVSGHDHHPLVGTQRTLGMYQPDLGALFLIRESVFHFSPLLLDDVKANIVEAVADYGATLGQVQSNEHVIVEYRPDRTTHLL